MPFITEEIWYALYDEKPPAKSIALTAYPIADTVDKNAQEQMKYLQNVISNSRFKRIDQGVPEKEQVPLTIFAREGVKQVFIDNLAQISKFVRTSSITFSDSELEGHGVFHYFHHFQIRIDYEAKIDVPAERERLKKEIVKYEKGLASAERQLSNESFLAKAPAQVVEGLKKQQFETSQLLEKVRAALSALPAE